MKQSKKLKNKLLRTIYVDEELHVAARTRCVAEKTNFSRKVGELLKAWLGFK